METWTASGFQWLCKRRWRSSKRGSSDVCLPTRLWSRFGRQTARLSGTVSMPCCRPGVGGCRPQGICTRMKRSPSIYAECIEHTTELGELSKCKSANRVLLFVQRSQVDILASVLISVDSIVAIWVFNDALSAHSRLSVTKDHRWEVRLLWQL